MVSVIIPTFNRADRIEKAVSSVLKQTYENYEIIVVNDGSTDTTEDALLPFEDKIRYISFSENRGVSAARNAGIRHSRGSLIAFLDSDDYWFENKLALQTTFFKRHPQTVACQTNEIWIRNGLRVNPRKKHLKPAGRIFADCVKLCVVSPSTVMLKKSLLEEVGLFDENLPACEDYDLWLRIASLYPIDLIADPLAVREGGRSDQLSRKHQGMDRFRVYALVKILGSGLLNEEHFRAAWDELTVKCGIYGRGCLKRGRHEEGGFYLSLPERLLQYRCHAQGPSRPFSAP
jgi:glycosyltransferase involved in cell wall biosynthesis